MPPRRIKKPPRSRKKDFTSQNLSKTVLQLIQGRRYSPLSLEEIQAQLHLPPLHKNSLESILNQWVEEGKLCLRQGKYALVQTEGVFQGVISVHPKGFGFVPQEEGGDVFIPKHSLLDAVDGDEVEVRICRETSPKGPEGEVIAILKRSRSHLAGTVFEKTEQGYHAYVPLLGPDKPVLVKLQEGSLQEGDRILCKVTHWSEQGKGIQTELTRVLGHISDPSIDVLSAVEEFELPSQFSQEAIAEAKSFGTQIDPREVSKRYNLTEMECVTIDPDTAKDFDDAITLTQDERGHFLLGVHIADVAHYVKPGSCLDKEALTRCNSTYFPGTCIPMLPEELSNELCSLKPRVPRLTQSIFAEFDPEGTLLDYQIERSVIRSQERFSYQDALAILQGKKESPHAPLLKRMEQLCYLLKKKRMERGSIDFSMAENRLAVDPQGIPLQMEKLEYDITHQMIEEFMLKANEIAAFHLQKNNRSPIYRVHEEPAQESFRDFFTFARSLGFSLPAKPTHRDIQTLFIQAKNSPLLPTLSIQFIRSMRLACYSIENIGHYGLALEHYCHFTSPIRRYTDLIIQRLLFEQPTSAEEIEEIASACSEKERLSFRAESSVLLLKKLRLAQTYFLEDPSRIYPAVVTKVKAFALFFEVPEFDLESQLHISKIGQDFYEFDAKRLSFRGRRTGQKISIGDTIYVQMQSVDLALRQSAWVIAPPAAKTPSSHA